MNMKKEKKTDFIAILVYLAMIGLLAIIILPPVLRTLLPKNETVVEKPKDKVEALVCNKRMEIEGVPVTIKATTNYKNDIITRLLIVYTKEESPVNENQEMTIDPFTTLSEIESFKSLSNVQFTQDESQVKVDIAQSVLATMKNDPFLKDYNQSIEEQGTFFQGQGYTCQILSSE